MKTLIPSQQAMRAVAVWPVWRVRTVMPELIAALILLVVVAGLSLVARQNVPTYTVDLTAKWPDTRLHLVDFYAREENKEFNYRWSSAYSFVQLPSAYHAAPVYRANVRMRIAHPQWMQPVTFLSNEHAFVTVTPDTTFRVYHFIMPSYGDADGTLRLALQTVPFSPPGDRRDLGVVLTGVTLQPLPYRSWSVALVLPLALLGLWVWLRWLNTSSGATIMICSGLALVLLAFYLFYHPSPLRYEWLVLLVVLAAAAGVVVAHTVVTRLALCFLVALISFSGVLWPSWMSDDAFISFRYAQNLVSGHGLVYNVGERVEGYTNFLWTMLAAFVLTFGGNLLFWAYVAGVSLALAIGLITYWLGQRLMGPVWALVATLLVATSQSLLIYTARGSGLETGLFTLLALVSSAMYLVSAELLCDYSRDEKRLPIARNAVAMLGQHVYFVRSASSLAIVISGMGFAVTTLTRPEGALLMGLTVCHLLVVNAAKRTSHQITSNALSLAFRRVWLILLAYLCIVVPYFLWRVSYYGDLLPNTFYAKTGGGMQQVWRGLAYAGTFALASGGPLLFLLLVPLVTRRRTILHNWQGYLLLLVGLYSAYIIAIGGDHFPGERFFVPLVPWVALLMASGMAEVYALVQHQIWQRRLVATMLALILLLYCPYALLRSAAFDTVITGNDESVWIWRELGWWLHDNTPVDASVAALGAGAVAYYSERTTVDLLGLTDKHIARVAVNNMGSGVAGHEKQDPAYVLHERRPTYIPRMWDGYFGGEQVLRKQYTLIQVRSRYGRKLELWQRLP